jgi:thiamine-monophosphate kinase
LQSEAQIIERIRRRFSLRAAPHPDWLRLGLGDDAAVILACAKNTGAAKGKSGNARREWVLSCDAFLEDVHFRAGLHPPGAVGYKALARATSDLAAMGARPRFFLLSLALPAARCGVWLDGFLTGLARASRQFEIVLAGGDTSRFPKVAVSITVGGEVTAGHALTRAGARPGDLIFVSGTLGAAQLGLELILRGLVKNRAGNQRWRRVLAAHTRPEIRLKLGMWLSGEQPRGSRVASAAIDTSDGLSTDLNHICESSGVGARIQEELLPIMRIPSIFHKIGLSALELALHGGEDYQLLFTVPARVAGRVHGSYYGVKITQIGEITRRRHVELIRGDGRSERLLPRGWDHFRKT